MIIKSKQLVRIILTRGLKNWAIRHSNSNAQKKQLCIVFLLYAYPAIFAMKGFSSSQFLLENDSSFFAKLIRVPSAVTM